MGKNPYEFLHPVRGARFVGRHALANEICQELSYAEGASFAIIGGRRSGKSSLLFSIQDRILSIPDYKNNLCIFIDFNQRFPSPEKFFSHTLGELYCQALPRFHNSNYIRRFAGVINQEVSYRDFVIAIQSLLEMLPENMRIGLLLDEMDTILRFDWHDTLFDQLRTLAYSSPVTDSINLVMAGTYYYYGENNRGSPLMNILRPVHLQDMQETAIYELAKLGGEVSDEITKEVWRYSGGHPHLAQYIFYNLWQISPGFVNLESDAVFRVVKQYYRDFSHNLKNWIASTGEDGCIVYDFLSKKNDWVDEEDVAKKLSMSMNRTKQALVNLCFLGVAGENPKTGSDYCARGDLFRNWFLQNRDELICSKDEQKSTRQELSPTQIGINHMEITQNINEAWNVIGNISQKNGMTAAEISNLMKDVFEKIETRSNTTDQNKKAITKTVVEIQEKLSSGKPSPSFLGTRLKNIQKMAPDIYDVVIDTLTNPALGLKTLVEKIAEKIKKDAEENITTI